MKKKLNIDVNSLDVNPLLNEKIKVKNHLYKIEIKNNLLELMHHLQNLMIEMVGLNLQKQQLKL